MNRHPILCEITYIDVCFLVNTLIRFSITTMQKYQKCKKHVIAVVQSLVKNASSS